MSYSQIAASPFTVWRDEKNHNLIVVLCISYDVEHDGSHLEGAADKVVVFSCCITGLIKHMSMEKFLDGRYVPIGFRLEENKSVMGAKGCIAKIQLPDGSQGKCGLLQNHQGMHVIGES